MVKDKFGEKCRRSVVGLENQVPLADGGYVRGVNFDNAATTPPFCAVMRQIHAFAPWYSSVHRGTGYKSMVSSDLYDEGREKIKKFVGADRERDLLIYTKNTTESINILAEAFYQNVPDAVILCTQMEHLANDLPWRSRFQVDYARVDSLGYLDLNDLEARLIKHGGRVKLLAMTGASNVTGYINPIHEAAELAHRHGAEILVDGAQLVPHKAVDMKSYGTGGHIDYLAFSGHKMYAPFGIGALIGPARTFCAGAPYLKGGGAVKLVTEDTVFWDDPPYKEEAGTPNVIGAAALLKAMDCLSKLGMERIHEREQMLMAYIEAGLRRIPELCLYGGEKAHQAKVSMISFLLPGLHHRLIAQILSYEFGIAVRSGLFCAHPYVQKLLGMTPEKIAYYRLHPQMPFPGMVRVSLGLYQHIEEAERLLQAVRCIVDNRREYKKKYENWSERLEAGQALHAISRQLI